MEWKNLNEMDLQQLKDYKLQLETELEWIFTDMDNNIGDWDTNYDSAGRLEEVLALVNNKINKLEQAFIDMDKDHEIMSVEQRNLLSDSVTRLQELERELAVFEQLKQEHKDIKESLLKAMEQYDIKKWELDNVTFTYVKERTGTKEYINNEKLYDKLVEYGDHIDNYKETKETKTKAHIRIKFK